MAELTMGHDLRCLFSKRINQLLEKCVSTSIVSVRRQNFSAFLFLAVCANRPLTFFSFDIHPRASASHLSDAVGVWKHHILPERIFVHILILEVMSRFTRFIFCLYRLVSPSNAHYFVFLFDHLVRMYQINALLGMESCHGFRYAESPTSLR